jgi:hypothetical protein
MSVFLSTGTEIYANCDLVSIPIVETDGDNPLEFGEGYDGHIFVREGGSEYYTITVEESLEVCDLMLEAWKRRKEKLRRIKNIQDEVDEVGL